MRPPAVLAIHGGAGPAPADPDGAGARWARQATGLAAALRAGRALLAGGGSALDAVVAAVAVLEDDEEWNAGRGSSLTSAGTVEMDAAVADGRTRQVGAVAGVTGVRHPVEAARAVMDDGRHVLLAGPGAEAYARTAGITFEPEEWFVTDYRRKALIQWATTRGSRGAERPRAREADPAQGSVGAPRIAANWSGGPGVPPRRRGLPIRWTAWVCGPTASSTRAGRTPTASPSGSATSTSPPKRPGAARRTAPPSSPAWPMSAG